MDPRVATRGSRRLTVSSMWRFAARGRFIYATRQSLAKNYQWVDVAPFKVDDFQPGETPAVLSVSWGKGDPQKDHITLVFLDEAGRLREYTRIDNLNDLEFQDEFRGFVRRRKPDV